MAAAHTLSRETNALIDTPGDLIRATLMLITVSRTLTPSPAQLIATPRQVIAPPSDLIRATTPLITPLWALIAPPRWPITAISWLLRSARRTDDRSIESI